MTDNQFDDIFKKRLENFDSKVPDDMWQRINKKDKDRKGFFIPRWYMLALLLLFTGLTSVYVFFYKG
jgi:cytoskeletal protein RodZ